MEPRRTRDDPTARGEAPTAAADALCAGDVIDGRYRVEALLDRGGMSDVYRCAQPSLGRVVALKVMRASLADDPSAPARLLSEARAMQSIDHPHVVKVLDYGNHRGRPYLVLELLRGESLRAHLDREAPLSPAHALALFDPVLGALQAVHDAGLVHRDVKPSNVFLARERGVVTPKLLDFGIARRAVDSRLTTTGALLGTPAYMSPEQARGDRELTAASDQYSAAAVLYEAVTGRLPHDVSTPGLALAARITVDPPPPTRWRDDLDPAFARALTRALARDPAARFPSIDVFREALRSAPEVTRARRLYGTMFVALSLALALVLIAFARVSRTPPRAAQALTLSLRAPPPPSNAPEAPSPVTVPRDAGAAIPMIERSRPRARANAPASRDGPRLRMTLFRDMP